MVKCTSSRNRKATFDHLQTKCKSSIIQDNIIITGNPQLLPHVVEWTTYGLCSLLTVIWNKFKNHNIDQEPVPHYWIEIVASLERALNYAHTGNCKVLTKGLMDPLWLSLSLVHDGLPSVSPIIVPSAMFGEQVDIRRVDWPTRGSQPMVSSKKAQIVNYGIDHYKVCVFSVVCESTHFPQLRECANIKSDPF